MSSLQNSSFWPLFLPLLPERRSQNLLLSSRGWKNQLVKIFCGMESSRKRKKKNLRAEILNSANFTCISHAPGCALRAGQEAPASAPSCTGTSSLQAGALGVGLVVCSSNLRCQDGSRDAAWQADLRLLCFGSTSLRLGLWGKTRTFLQGKHYFCRSCVFHQKTADQKRCGQTRLG